MIWAERNNIDAKAQSVIYLKENHIDSLNELEAQIKSLRSKRNALYADIRKSNKRMQEINRLRKAIRDYRRTKTIYAQYKESGWSAKFFNEHCAEIEAHKKAQAVYSSVEGKMPTLNELTAEYAALRDKKELDRTEIEAMKPKITTLNHVKYNFDILSRDEVPAAEERRRHRSPER